MSGKEPDHIDKLVGRNIRLHRLKRGMSQEKLGDALGITFQQVQKYERGVNRVGSGRLHKISSLFNVPVAALFEGSDGKSGSTESLLDLVADPQSMRLVQAIGEIDDTELRRSLVDLVENIAKRVTADAGKPLRGGARVLIATDCWP
jgi:transcriptional regulator with XRE-family HTH domain